MRARPFSMIVAVIAVIALAACGGGGNKAATNPTDATGSATGSASASATSKSASTRSSTASAPAVTLTEAMCPSVEDVNALQINPSPYGNREADVSDEGGLYCRYQQKKQNTSTDGVTIQVFQSSSAEAALRHGTNLEAYDGGEAQVETGLTRADAASSGISGYRMLRVSVGTLRVQVDCNPDGGITVEGLRKLYELFQPNLP